MFTYTSHATLKQFQIDTFEVQSSYIYDSSRHLQNEVNQNKTFGHIKKLPKNDFRQQYKLSVGEKFFVYWGNDVTTWLTKIAKPTTAMATTFLSLQIDTIRRSCWMSRKCLPRATIGYRVISVLIALKITRGLTSRLRVVTSAVFWVHVIYALHNSIPKILKSGIIEPPLSVCDIIRGALTVIILNILVTLTVPSVTDFFLLIP